MLQYLKSLLRFLAVLPSRALLYLRALALHGRVDFSNELDHPLLKQRLQLKSYATSYARYPGIRALYNPHVHAAKLGSTAHPPLLVFVHGLGGSLPQFAFLLGTLVNIAPTFGIELPGHGGSDFAPTNYEAYTIEALTELWKVAIEEICDQHGYTQIVLICHSLGCSIGATLASKTTDLHHRIKITGLIAICPKAAPPTQRQVTTYRRLLGLPDILLDVLRVLDRWGGESSKSVRRFVGETADTDLRKLQLRFNRQFKTPVWKRTTIGLLPQFDHNGVPYGGLPGRRVWERVKVPLLLIAGEADTVTKATEATEILEFVQGRAGSQAGEQTQIPVENGDESQSEHVKFANEEEYGVQPIQLVIEENKNALVTKLVVIPSPASHALMYDHATCRTTAGLIEDFLSRHISHELELGWQLQQLTTSGKWDVKNLEKWKRVSPVSGPIDHGLFRALKTLREQDEVHTPLVFLQTWGGKFYAIIDISHDSPIYDTNVLEKGGVQYHKFPTVSKIPPTPIEVQDFITLVDRLRKEVDEQYSQPEARPAIGVHCHYGYNRTGFFIVSYLVERRGYGVQDAIEEFARHKSPGIRHEHFIDTLFVRYCVGLRRNSTSK